MDQSIKRRVGTLVIVLGFVVMVIGFVTVMVDTSFGRGETCRAEQTGHDRYVDGESVERVVDVVWVGDCDWNSPEMTLTEPVGVLEWD